MVTKAIIQSINAAGNRCVVRMPLFETAANPNPVEAEALVNITPGLFNNLEVGDIVFIIFEESAIEKPIIIGKLFRGADTENNIRGGGAIVDTLKVRSLASIPASTIFEFSDSTKSTYKDFNTPKKIADYLKWLENFTKVTIARLENHFQCFKNWTQWQFRPENIEIDDGDLDIESSMQEPYLYQAECAECKLCGSSCTKNNNRTYVKLPVDKNYPNI